MSYDLQNFQTDVIEKQRDYDGGGAREVCKAIVQLLGLRHPVVEKHFRAFSSALDA